MAPPLTDSVERWIESSGCAHERLSSPRVLVHEGFSQFAGGSEFRCLESFDLPARFLVGQRNCRIRGRDGYVILPDGSYLMENTSEKWLLGNPAYFQRLQCKPKEIAGPMFSLVGMHCREHYHWLHDSLTLLHRIVQHLPRATRFLVPNRLQPEKINLLEGFGIDRGKILIYDPEEPIAPEILFLATAAAPQRFDDPGAVAWVRERLIDYLHLKPTPRRRLFISRQGAATRRIRNLGEIEPILRSLDFQIITPELMSLAEQAKLFSQASIIAGPHGAAHTNMLFSHRDCRILDVFAGEIGFRTYYASLAAAIGMPYRCMIAQPTADAYDPEEMHVDPAKLAEKLTGITRGATSEANPVSEALE